MWEYDRVGNHDFLGRTNLDLELVPLSMPSKTVELTHRTRGGNGKLKMDDRAEGTITFALEQKPIQLDEFVDCSMDPVRVRPGRGRDPRALAD